MPRSQAWRQYPVIIPGKAGVNGIESILTPGRYRIDATKHINIPNHFRLSAELILYILRTNVLR